MHNFAIMKLKRHIGILLSALILFSSIGLALNVHYCHGTVSAVSLSYRLKDACNDQAPKKDKKGCCAAAGKSHKSCCKNDVVKLQDNGDRTLVKSLQLDLAAFYVANVYNPLQLFYSPAAKQKKENPSFYAQSNAPPLYKLYCQYVLYA